MKKLLSLIFVTMFIVCHAFAAQGTRWTAEKAWKWYKQQPWLCGVNYIPAYAINYTAMWDKTSFSPKDIDKELSLMKDLKMNCVRVVLQYAVYADDPKYFLNTFDKFLSICDKYGIKVMPIFFDDCAFGVNRDPAIGKQPEPLDGWYAWAWSPSPGQTMVVDQRTHGKLEKYVKDIITRHANDRRILAWDLYNEPGSDAAIIKSSMNLLREVFSWARDVNPSQPLTTCFYRDDKEMNQFLDDNCDIISFHCYADESWTRKDVDKMLAKGRPVICTEWMNRVVKSTYTDILPLFREKNIGSMSWGLVNGKDQTNLPWGHRPEMGKYTGVWQHDIFKGDFTPYDSTDIETINRIVNSQLVTPGATDKAKELYYYLLGNYGKKTLSAVMANIDWNHDDAEKVYRWTGKYPAINCFDFMHIMWSGRNKHPDYNDIKPITEWADSGGIVSLIWHCYVPKREQFASIDNISDSLAFYIEGTNFRTANIFKSDSWEHKWFYSQMDKVCNIILRLQDKGIAALWRPWHEAAGNAMLKTNGEVGKPWFWWGNDGAEVYKKLWRTMFDYFQAKGIHNLIWVWTSQNNNGDSTKYNNDSTWYPGDKYVDIIGRDLYNFDAAKQKEEFQQLQARYPNKMITLAECGADKSTNFQLTDVLMAWNAGAKWSWFMPWYGSLLPQDYWWKTALYSPNVITRDQLPHNNTK